MFYYSLLVTSNRKAVGLRGSSGISVDNDGNVYVVGYHSNNAVVISPDGQRHIQLLSSENGLKESRVIDYDKSTNMLLVVNRYLCYCLCSKVSLQM
jgi:DNA-binding beta-propeller fold protein YncE